MKTLFAKAEKQRLRALRPLHCLLLLAVVCALAATAWAQTSTQIIVTNTAAIAVADATQTGPGLGNPYPSGINVAGLNGAITDVDVRLNGFSHPFPADIGLLLVGPGGQSLVLQSIAGNEPATNVTYTFDDQATSLLDEQGALLSQSYRPSAYRPGTFAGVFFPASGANPPPAICQTPTNCPNPATVGAATLASVFNGVNPNGTWRLYAADFSREDAGAYNGGWSLIITTSGGAGATMQFNAPNFNVNENGVASLTVTRGGDTAGASTVDFATTDSFAFTECNAAGPNANQRCDYTVSRGTISFAAGETSKAIFVPITDDLYTESAETFNVALSNPTGGTIGAQGASTVTIADNDTMAGANRLFVAQINAAQEVPANNSAATGFGALLLNDAETQITVNMTFSGLGSAQTAAHIHLPAHVGVNGPVAFNLGTGQISNMTFAVTAAQVAQMRAGLLYFNIHTANNAAGEIRGQIVSQPMENARFFARQQYYDFLNREPDAPGLDYWTGQIVTVAGTDLALIRQRRVAVANAFFFEQEYQETGAYVFRLYRAAYGNTQPWPNPETTALPGYAAFVSDRAQTVGSANLPAAQLALATAFANRAEFTARYPASQTAAQFVDAVLGNIQAASGANLTAQRDALIALFGTGGRGAVMYRLADATAGNPIVNTAFIDAEYNRSFVATEYYGFLRRDADLGGFSFWLNVVNSFPLRSVSGQSAMVCAFITSAEFQQRFSLGITRNNQECPPAP